MQCTARPFGKLESGEEVTAYTLTNNLGNSVTVLNYGGIIQSLIVPDKEGRKANIVLGYNTIEAYLKYAPYFGTITGRTAGRISGGGFTIDGKRYELEGPGGVNLHGGPVGLDQRIWHVAEAVADNHGELILSYTSPHLENGFPGEVDMVVTYQFDEEDTLSITYKATTNAPTILTLTNHSYFNLSGQPDKDVLGHKLTIPADKVVAIDEFSIPKNLDDVEGTAFDFRRAKAIGAQIHEDDENLKNGSGYDHPFVLNKDEDETILLTDPVSGREMTIRTSEQCVVCYTGNFLDEVPYVYDNVKVDKYHGVCLETQYYPDAINADFLPERILRPGEVYLEETTYRFAVAAGYEE